eukprot:g4913.t1
MPSVPSVPGGMSGGQEEAYAPGTLIWIRSDDEVWQAAEVLSSGNGEIVVKVESSNEQLVINPSKDPIYLRSRDLYTADGLVALDDLTQLTHLHEPAVLHSLQMRFDIDKIYTFTGPILIAVNPFKSISDLYSLKTLKSYIAGNKDQNAKPHVYATAAASFKGLCEGDTSQTILISGESGAGKTETTKFVMKFLALAGAGEAGVSDVERQVLESNPLLEAFGNARTLRNDNSSRFGKFIELQFKPESSAAVNYRLCGARIHTYLLEKVRVTEQQEGERNFHLFYQACAAAAAAATSAGVTDITPGDPITYKFPQLRQDASRQATLDLTGFAQFSHFRYLTRSTCWQLKDVSDVLQFEHTINAMLTIGIPETQGFVNKLVKQHTGHRRFDVIRTRQSWFVVKHFAGPVGYESANFLDKNKDQLSMDVVDLMKGSSNEYVANLFLTDKKFQEMAAAAAGERRMSKKRIVTISSEFRDQLQHLMTTVKATEPHFIRCIKPNPENLGDVYDRPGVTEQLRYGGVLQVVQVSRAGYPVRVKPQDAWLDYHILLPAHLRKDYEEMDIKIEDKVKKMLTYLVRELNIVISHSVGPVWAVGKTLVFFKQLTYERISQRRLIIRGAAAVKIQAKYKAVKAAREYELLQFCVYKRIRVAIIAVQAGYRGMKGRRCFREHRERVYCTRIQSKWRAVLERRVFVAMRAGIHQMQTRWRMKQAKTQMKKLKAEAKEVGNLLAKHQKQQELVKEQQKKLQDTESHGLQLMAENKDLQAHVGKLEEQLKKQEGRVNEIQKEEEEKRKKELEEGQMAKIKTEELDSLQKEADELRTENAALKEEITDMKAEIEKLKQQVEQSNTRYTQLLKNTAMQSMGNSGPGMEGGAGGRRAAGHRSVDIQLVGAQGVGKTMLLERLIRESDPAQLSKFNQDRSNFMGRYQAESFALGKDLMRSATAAGAGCVFFGNKFRLEKENGETKVDVMAAKDIAAQCGALAVESSDVREAVRMIQRDIESEHQAGSESNSKARTPGAMSQVFDRVSNMFGGPKRGSLTDNQALRLAQVGVLKPSLKGTKLMKQNRREGDVATELRPVQELQDSESAVTCIVFGQERLHRGYILLAAASKDGTVVIYRCYRTEMELSILDSSDFPTAGDDERHDGADHSNIAVHSRLVGHSRAITSIFFNLLEDQLVTTSIDKSVRFWSVETGEMLKVFTDSSPVPVATFLPFNPQVLCRETRWGTKNGSIHVLEASDSSTLKFRFKVQLARGGVTCITFVPAAHQNPPCLLVNTSDSSVTIIDCTYGPPAGVLTNLTVRHRVKVAHSLLPLKCCHSPSGTGYLISGSEDKEVYIYSLGRQNNYKMQYLKHHLVPVVAVATNYQDTLLASADSLGRIVLWRRMDFSHLGHQE